MGEMDLKSFFYWGGIILLFGCTFYLFQLRYLENWRWNFVTGVILVLLIDTLGRHFFPRYGRPLRGRVAMIIAIALVLGAEIGWPIILFATGILVIAYSRWETLKTILNYMKVARK